MVYYKVDSLKADKVLFFDLYQTLIDVELDSEKKKRNESEGWRAFAKNLEKFDIHIAPEGFLALYEKRRDDFYAAGRDRKIHHHNFLKIISQILREEFEINISDEEAVRLIYEYRKISRGYIRLYPKVFDTLQALRSSYTLAAASHTQGCFTQIELKELGIEPFFSYFIYTSDIGYRKTAIEFYVHCLKTVGKQPSDCVMIGDNYDADVLTPQKLGMKTIWIKNPATSGNYAAKSAEFSLDLEDFDKLPDLIPKLFQ